VVVDASVVVPGLLWVEGVEAAALEGDEPLDAPELLRVEVANGFRHQVFGEKTIDARQGVEALQRLEDLGIHYHSHGGALSRIWGLKDNLSAYDATYVALAERLDVPLLTADARLARAPGPRCPIRLIAP
jgi:predicted nucleic acid-binding protein